MVHVGGVWRHVHGQISKNPNPNTALLLCARAQQRATVPLTHDNISYAHPRTAPPKFCRCTCYHRRAASALACHAAHPSSRSRVLPCTCPIPPHSVPTQGESTAAAPHAHGQLEVRVGNALLPFLLRPARANAAALLQGQVSGFQLASQTPTPTPYGLREAGMACHVAQQDGLGGHVVHGGVAMERGPWLVATLSQGTLPGTHAACPGPTVATVQWGAMQGGVSFLGWQQRRGLAVLQITLPHACPFRPPVPACVSWGAVTFNKGTGPG